MTKIVKRVSSRGCGIMVPILHPESQRKTPAHVAHVHV